RIALRRWEVVRQEKAKEVPVASGDFLPDPSGQWTADLSKTEQGKLERGSYEIRAVVTTLEATPRKFQRPLSVHYLPEAPVIVFAKDYKEMRLRQPELQLLADVKPGAADQKVFTRYRRQDLGFNEAKDPTRIDVKLDLKLGQNFIEIVAVNA